MISLKEIKDLKAQLPRGYFKKVIEKSGASARTVSSFFSGDTYRDDIHLAALAIIEEHKEKQQLIQTKHRAIVSSK